MTDVRQTTGRLMLAAGDGDERAAREALRDLPKELNYQLVLSLAETAARAFAEVHGDRWRDALVFVMLDAELDGEVVDDASDG